MFALILILILNIFTFHIDNSLFLIIMDFLPIILFIFKL